MNHTHAVVSDETELVFAGFAAFLDPPKESAKAALAGLAADRVSVKIITGDNELVTQHIFAQLGLPVTGVLTGADILQMDDLALAARVEDVNLFCRVAPAQKNRIILALKRRGHVVGYLGDGINDAPSLHSADVGISVDSAVDVAKSAADMILLERDLRVLHAGVLEGRRTFGNIMKYIMMGTSSNFGNMFSMAGASLFLTFLPLLPKQILLTNLLTDIPEMTIATDRVDHELIDQPRRWDIAFIRRFMLTFGLVSSVFDYVTFGALLWILDASPEQFRTGWFVESVISASAIVLVIRTRRPFFASRPGRHLVLATLASGAVTLLIPFLPIAAPLGLTPMPPLFLFLLAAILAGYVMTAEMVKRRFYASARNP
jgi:P-type Mg2+ transporter